MVVNVPINMLLSNSCCLL